MGFNNFSWVIEGKLAGSGIPGGRQIARTASQSADLADLRKAGIKVLVSLEKMPAGFGNSVAKASMEWMEFPIRDFESPDDSEAFGRLVDTVIRAIQSGNPVCVHCQAGVGRTGLVLACILGRLYGISGRQAISAVRKVRTALETEEQIRFAQDFCRTDG